MNIPRGVKAQVLAVYSNSSCAYQHHSSGGRDEKSPANKAEQAGDADDLICFDTSALLNICHCAFAGRGI